MLADSGGHGGRPGQGIETGPDQVSRERMEESDIPASTTPLMLT